MKVKASDKLKHYRNKTLGLDIKDFRNLQQGKSADITADKIKANPDAYIKEGKNVSSL